MAKYAQALEELDKMDVNGDAKSVFTLDEVRKQNCINIVLPYARDEDDPEHLEQYEYVTVNGRTTQIRKGEVVGVSWEIYEALKHSNQYKDQKILA